jgi:hypothetical protein
MSEFKNSRFDVKGNSNSFGDNIRNTSIESVNINNVTNVNAKGGGDPEGDPRLAAAVALFAVVTVTWFYLRHFFQIHESLYLGCFLSIAPALLYVPVALTRGDDMLASCLKVAPMCLVAACLVVLLAQIRTGMPQEVLELAASATARETWAHLSDYGKRLVLESGGASTICALAIILNLLAGVRMFAGAVGGWAGWLLRMTQSFKLGRTVAANTMFMVVAWGLSSGVAYQYWKAFQTAMSPA